MRLKSIEEALYVIMAANAMFLLGMIIGDRGAVFAPTRSVQARRVGTPSETSRVVAGIARMHPDPDVSGPFASMLESGEIEVRPKKSERGEVASIGPNRGIYLLTIDPNLVKTRLTKEELEDVFMVLSHEHQHYRQFVETRTDEISPLSDTQCTMIVLYEVDAYGKSCRDAIRYGWSGPWKDDFCGRTTAQIAENILEKQKRSSPECVENWKFFSRRQVN